MAPQAMSRIGQRVLRSRLSVRLWTVWAGLVIGMGSHPSCPLVDISEENFSVPDASFSLRGF